MPVHRVVLYAVIVCCLAGLPVHAHHDAGHTDSSVPMIVGGVLGTATVGAVLAATMTPKKRWVRAWRKRNAARTKAGLPAVDYCTTLAAEHPEWAAKDAACR